MLYEECKPYIKNKTNTPKKIVDDMVAFKVNNFDDTLRLYINVVSICKGLGIVEISDIKVEKFNKSKFNSYFLRLGMQSRKENFVIMALKSAASYIDGYMSSKLTKPNPQYKYIGELSRGNMTNMHLLFKVNTNKKSDETIFQYTNSAGEIVDVAKGTNFQKIKQDDLDDILTSELFNEQQVKDVKKAGDKMSFMNRRKFVFEAARVRFRNGDPFQEQSVLQLID